MFPGAHEFRIFVSHLQGIRGLTIIFEPEFTPNGRNRFGHRFIKPHLQNVQHVHTGVGELASGVIPKPPKIGIGVWVHTEAVWIERALGRWSQPHLPVQTRGWSTVRRIADSFRRFVGINPGASKRHFSNFATAYHFASFLEVLARSLPGARLHYAVVLPRSLDHLETVVAGHADRLLAVHILAGFAGLHSYVSMPVIRSRYEDSVNGCISK